jgi:uncharacterized phiE125 gp8 family phage protein
MPDIHQNLTRTIDAVFEPITVKQARLHLRVTQGTEKAIDAAGVATSLNGGAETGIPAATHGLSTSGGTAVVVSGTDNFDGKYITTSNTTADIIAIPVAFTAETFAGDEHVHHSGTEDEKIFDLIKSARIYAEQWQNRAYVSQTQVLRMDRFPRSGLAIILPRSPAIAVSSVQYVDSNGDTQTLSTDIYTVDIFSEPARIVEAFNQIWPVTRDVPNAVTVTYTCGYGTTRAAVPNNVKDAMKLLIGHWFENREAVTMLNTIPQELKRAVRSMLDIDKVTF